MTSARRSQSMGGVAWLDAPCWFRFDARPSLVWCVVADGGVCVKYGYTSPRAPRAGWTPCEMCACTCVLLVGTLVTRLSGAERFR